MNKKLIAVAVAAAFAAPAAFADAVLYGKLHTSVDMNDVEFDGDTVQDNWTMASRSSRVGIKGSEDLGGGLKAIYQVELDIAMDGNEKNSNGQDGFSGIRSQRNTFIGLAGDWGTFLVGRHDTPAKMAFYAAGNDRLGDSIIDINNGTTGVFHEFRADNAIAYVSPNFSGFTLAAAVVPGEDSGVEGATGTGNVKVKAGLFGQSTTLTLTGLDTTAPNDRDGIADHYSVGLMYSGNGLKAGIGYENLDLQNLKNDAVDDQQTMQVGASYTMNNFSIGAQYEDTDNLGGFKDVDKKAWAVTGKASFGNNAVSLVYTNATIDAGSEEIVDGDAWGLAAEHNFSKRTKVYAAYATNDVDLVTDYDAENDEFGGKANGDTDTFSLGMIHSF